MTTKAKQHRPTTRRKVNGGSKTKHYYSMPQFILELRQNKHVRSIVNAGWAVILLFGLLCLVRHHLKLGFDGLDIGASKAIARELLATILIVVYVLADGAGRASQGFKAIFHYTGIGLHKLATCFEKIGNWFDRR